MFVVTVEFEIRSDCIEEFNLAIRNQAATSLEVESECHRFDICLDPDSSQRTFLYELYTDRAAFEQHLASEHFKQFDETVSGWIVSKKVDIWELI